MLGRRALLKGFGAVLLIGVTRPSLASFLPVADATPAPLWTGYWIFDAPTGVYKNHEMTAVLNAAARERGPLRMLSGSPDNPFTGQLVRVCRYFHGKGVLEPDLRAAIPADYCRSRSIALYGMTERTGLEYGIAWPWSGPLPGPKVARAPTSA